jgi:hypothetical protein
MSRQESFEYEGASSNYEPDDSYVFWCDRRFTLDGESIDIDNFLLEHGEDDDVDQVEIAKLDVREEMAFGGGAHPIHILRRIR